MNENKKKVVVVPDVHGRTFWENVKQKTADADEIIFLGDYVDPYAYEEDVDQTTKGLLNNFSNIISFAKYCPCKCILLLGNHDLHYLFNSVEECSRFDDRIKSEFKRLYSENKGLFKFAYSLENVLFTHAGVSNEWLKSNGLEFDGTAKGLADLINEIGEDENNVGKILCQCGPYRWGWDRQSGPMWCDINEHSDLTHPESIKQIISHTQVEAPTFCSDKSCLCVDCKRIYETEI